jgi:hypothetical protein
MPAKQALFICWVLGSAAAMVIGAFGPWMKLFRTSSRGIDGLNDGWLVVIAAVAGGAAFLWKRDPASAGVALGCGCFGGAVAIYDRWLLGDTAEGTDGLIQVGWGVNLAVIASISLAAAGLGWILTSEGADTPAASSAGAAPVASATAVFAPDLKSTTSPPLAAPNATDPTG